MNWLNIISICISGLSMYFAYKALSVWKGQKKYEVYQNAYKFLILLQEKMIYLQELYKDLDSFEVEDEENRINEEVEQFFNIYLGTLKSIELELQQIADENKIIYYFIQIFKFYSGSISAPPNINIQSNYNYEAEKYIVAPYNKSFYKDYFLTDDNDEKKELYKTFSLKIDEGLVYFTEKIKKYFK